MQTGEKTDYFQDLEKYKAELAEIDSLFIVISQKRENLTKICESLENLANVKLSPQTFHENSKNDKEYYSTTETNLFPNKPMIFEEIQKEEIPDSNENTVFADERNQAISLSFKGIKSTKATVEFLKFIGKKQKTKQISEGIRKYGYESNTEHPESSLRTSLRPHIHPKGRLTYNNKTHLWGLAEWETDLTDTSN
jgi:hypothetical protein